MNFKFWNKPKPQPTKTKSEKPQPLRFYGYGNSLCQVGRAPWPPVLRDDSSYDREELYQLVADALNVKHRYSFVRKQLTASVAAYDRGDITKTQLGDDLIHMLEVIKKDEKADEPLFAEHKVRLAAYRRRGDWGG
jgi:hypothetical protein